MLTDGRLQKEISRFSRYARSLRFFLRDLDGDRPKGLCLSYFCGCYRVNLMIYQMIKLFFIMFFIEFHSFDI